MEWLDRGTYTLEEKHPPLSRAPLAVGPYLAGARASDARDRLSEGERILFADGQWQQTLRLARLGTLPFVALLGWLVFVLGRHAYGPWAGAIAVAALSGLPPLVGHAGVATMDVIGATCLLGAALALLRWFDAPSSRRAAVVGIGCAAALTSKLSALLFLPVVYASAVMALLVAGRIEQLPRVRALVKQVMVAGISFALAVWIVYRFSVGPLADVREAPFEGLDALLGWNPVLQEWSYRVVTAPLTPAREFVFGVLQALRHNAVGHRSYFLGEAADAAWPLFFPVAVLLKTPLLLLATAAVGAVFAVRQRRGNAWAVFPPIAVLLLLGALATTGINLGLRHALILHPLLAVLIGVALTRAAERLPRGVAAVAAVAVLGSGWVATARALPTPYAYFNVLADDRPQDFLIFSDLVWGQDTPALADALAEVGAESVSIALITNLSEREVGAFGLPRIRFLRPFEPDTGWVAVDWYSLRIGANSDARVPSDAYQWLQAHVPVRKIGTGTFLYRFDSLPSLPASSQAAAARWRDISGGEFQDAHAYRANSVIPRRSF
jgi:hypothetical protein